MASLCQAISSYLLSNPNTKKIVDYGCGNAILLTKLNDTGILNEYSEIKYIGFDFRNILPRAFKTVNNINMNDRAVLLSYEENKWTDYIKDPCFIAIRDVIHELKIDQLAEPIYNICASLNEKSIMLLQDMTILPVLVKGKLRVEPRKAGWSGSDLKEIFQKGGLKTSCIPDTSKAGVDIFSIEGRNDSGCKLTKEEIYNLLINARKNQLDELMLKYKNIYKEQYSAEQILGIEHNITAIASELQDIISEEKYRTGFNPVWHLLRQR